MEIDNLKMRFLVEGETRITEYQFKNSTVEVTDDGEEMTIVYTNNNKRKFSYTSNELPTLYRILIKNLYNGFGIDKLELRSTITSIQAWQRRNNNQ